MTSSQIDIDDLSAMVERAIDRRDIPFVASTLEPLHVGEVVALLERLDIKRCAVVFRLLPKSEAVEVFELLDAPIQGDLVGALKDDEVARLFAELDPDDQASLLDELPALVATRLLQGLPLSERKLTAVVLGYPDDSIGRRMSPEFVSLHQSHTVGESMARVRERLQDAETIYALPVVDNARHLVGFMSLRQLMAEDDDRIVKDVMRSAHCVQATENEEVAARLCSDLMLMALPVVDAENRLVGILTVDDALSILEEADTEDQARMSGAEPLRRPYLATPLLEIVRARVVWLLVLAIGATLTVNVLEIFESTISKMVVLSVFIPLLIGTGGNTGNQAATTVTRALALNDVQPSDVLKVAGREIRVGFTLGLLLGGLGFVIAALVYGFAIGVVVGLTLVSVCTMAATLGGMMPLIGKLIRVDPAVFANPFISTLADATGLIIYFSIAKIVLGI